MCLGTAGAADYLQYGGHLVFLVREHVFHLQVFHLMLCFLVGGIHLFFSDQFILVEVEGERQFFYGGAHALVSFYPSLDALHLPHLCFCGFSVVPESRSLGVQLFFLKLNTLLIYLQVLLELICPPLQVLQLFYRYHYVSIFNFQSSLSAALAASLYATISPPVPSNVPPK